MSVLESVKQTIRSGIGRIVARVRPRDFGYQDDLVQLVEDEFKRRQNERRPFELQWRLNLAFLDGNHYIDLDPHTGELLPIPKMAVWQEREVFNHTAPIVETRIARLMRAQPTLKARPATEEPGDLASAKICTRLMQQVLNEQLDREHRQELLTWLETCGTVFLKNVWDPKGGRLIGRAAVRGAIKEQLQNEETVEDQMQHEGAETLGRDVSMEVDRAARETETQTLVEQQDDHVVAATIVPVYEGDVQALVIPPYEIYPDSCWHPTVDHCRSIIHARAYPVDEIYEMYGVLVDPEPVDSWELEATALGLGGLGYGRGGYRTTVKSRENYAVVKEYWEKPSLRYPEGRLIIVAGRKLLYAGPLPFMVGPEGQPAMPFVKIVSIMRPGCFWGRSIIERLIPIQRRYNALRNRKAEYLNRCAIGQMWVYENAVDLDDLENNAGMPGWVCVVKANGHPPQYIQNPPLPPAFETEEATLLNEFTIISGVSEIARHSQAPSGVKSGVALDIALEQDDTRLSHTMVNIEAGFIEAGKQWLRLYRQFATIPRIIRNVGTQNTIEVLQWDRSHIRSDDVVIETSALVSESPAVRRQMVFDLLASGLFNDPETGGLSKEGRAKVFELLEMGHWEFGNEDEKLHVAKAQRENKAMMNAAQVPVVDYDDHIVHIRLHNQWRLTVEYEEANAASGGVLEMVFQQHVEQHLMYLQRAAMA
ncbi:portal protein, partial [Desulfofundulus sp.]|uniref:portal protein n=1 Tax=Desulfofundulus sp. TaxID=2282750 RepID=UPI003C71A049